VKHRTFKKLFDKGKPDENRGRKAMGLPLQVLGYDRQAAKNNINY